MTDSWLIPATYRGRYNEFGTIVETVSEEMFGAMSEQYCNNNIANIEGTINAPNNASNVATDDGTILGEVSGANNIANIEGTINATNDASNVAD
ncbi:unnamed protein product [Didymodactylos carnosus]|uniref:Uncharacterized protein n=1 Tax=Didymodactylos carnosus TaxID=1234261 RepID=A0A814U9S2_9BILA|nr:unnamed protein product [Didymodactylos carnosus]CAF3936856.1 unnamed protein product [Didymodactylos carnosus]CAF4502266.1 unnamed protein product [Didymodactylos carnosus]